MLQYYDDDHSDDAYYGSRDQQKVMDVLLALRSDTMWGPERTAEELAQCPFVLESFMQYGNMLSCCIFIFCALSLLFLIFFVVQLFKALFNSWTTCLAVAAQKCMPTAYTHIASQKLLVATFRFCCQIHRRPLLCLHAFPFHGITVSLLFFCFFFPTQVLRSFGLGADKLRDILDTVCEPMSHSACLQWYGAFRVFLCAFNIEELPKRRTLQLLAQATPLTEQDIPCCVLPLFSLSSSSHV